MITGRSGNPEYWEEEFESCEGRRLDPWTRNIGMAAARMAVAKASGRYWDPAETQRVGPWEVGLGYLYAQEGIADDEVLILVSFQRLPTLEICGWLYGCECKRPDFFYEQWRY